MADRKEGLSRTLRLVRALAESTEGLTIDEMAEVLGQRRRSAERTRSVIAGEFELFEIMDGRQKRFRIPDSLSRSYTRPSTEELAALQAESEASRKEGSPRADLLARLLGKLKTSYDDRDKRRIDPDLHELARLQSTITGPGPRVDVQPSTYAKLAQAIMAGMCVEFHYRSAGRDEAEWRRVVPYGLVQGPVPYLVGLIPDSEFGLLLYRLDRMEGVTLSDLSGSAPDDFDLDAWLSESFGIWREPLHEIELRILPHAEERARAWHFHRTQRFVENGEGLRVIFRAGGLREIAEHLFTWAGDVEILAPSELVREMQARLLLAQSCCPAESSSPC